MTDRVCSDTEIISYNFIWFYMVLYGFIYLNYTIISALYEHFSEKSKTRLYFQDFSLCQFAKLNLSWWFEHFSKSSW